MMLLKLNHSVLDYDFVSYYIIIIIYIHTYMAYGYLKKNRTLAAKQAVCLTIKYFNFFQI